MNQPMLLGEQLHQVCLLSETWRIASTSCNSEDHRCHQVHYINHRDQKNQKKREVQIEKITEILITATNLSSLLLAVEFD